MRYVILRDDDTNALTPVDCLEQLYRPFLDRGLPVNLAVIPEVRTNVRRADGRLEGFLSVGRQTEFETMPMEENPNLVAYLRTNKGFHFAQHGCFHDYFEFDQLDQPAAIRLVELGAQRLQEAGFATPRAFVAPYDRISRAGLLAVARRFDVLSTGWFELGRQPRTWLSRYLLKKIRRAPHWRVGRLAMLSHPGCLLSCTRPVGPMLDAVRRQIEKQRLTVLVTHWWEYFREGIPDRAFIDVLHETADYLAAVPDLRVISFDELADGGVLLT
ncbi:MAG TPA: DUF2334 domain-containing protein [Opitutaceae bacterium]|jgi:hypothetical protein|nr:DUF2334 domain-containing protein [Opitutaceae bacterium]